MSEGGQVVMIYLPGKEFGVQDIYQNIKAMHQDEFDLELDTDKPYKNFQDRINVHREELITLVKKLKSEGKKIHITGHQPRVILSCNGAALIIRLLIV